MSGPAADSRTTANAATPTATETLAMDRMYLRQKMAANVKIIVFVMIFAFFFSAFVAITKDGFSNQHNLWGGVLMALLIGGPASAYLIYSDKGYRISYDDDAVYHRPHGLTLKLGYPPERAMRYADIDVVAGDPGRIINFGIMPFEFIRLYRKNWDGAELFMVSPFFLHHDEMKALIQLIHDKRPETFSQDVLDYLASDRRL